MFSGIVEGKGFLKSLDSGRLKVKIPWKQEDIHLGQSIAIDGCCLTVISIEKDSVVFDVSPETLDKTTLGLRKVDDSVNLERGLKLGDSLDGHMVSGHIDGKAKLRSIQNLDEAGSKELWFDVEPPFLRWLVEKGSVALDGVSLTVNRLDDQGFTVVLIPHTLEITTLGERKVGDQVNVEFDLLAKYLEKLVPGQRSHQRL